METLLELDKELFLFLNNLGGDTWDGFWIFITNKYNSIPVYLVLLVLTYRHLRLKKTILALVIVALMILCVDQLANIFKYGFERLRPCFDADVNDLMRQVRDSCQNRGQFSYFSAHAANSFSVAIFFSIVLRSMRAPIGIFLVVWAILFPTVGFILGFIFP